jgi:Fic family protein
MRSGIDEFDEDGTVCFRPFVPLPPRLELVADLLEKASDSVRHFDRKLQEWSNPQVVGRLFARLDAVSSSGAEGSTTTFTDLLEYESSLKSAPDVGDAASVAALSDSTMEAIDGGLQRLILLLHRRLFERGDTRRAALAGKLKDRTNRTADSAAPGGLFAYTRPASVAAALVEWEDFVLAESMETPELIRQCLGHWMFEHVHPVNDGNGRIGRLLIPIVLSHKGFTKTACAFVSEGVYGDKELYVDVLKDARVSNNMLGWTRLMLGFMDQGAKANLARLDHLLNLKREWQKAVAEVRSDSIIHQLVPFALTRPAFTIADAISHIGGTFASVNNAAAKLAELNILTVARGSRRDRLFQATAVLNAFDHFRAPQKLDTPEDENCFQP